jgi:predicted nucleic acid-binding protein
MMVFADLAAGDSVFLDANVFVYHFAPEPVLGPYCSQLLQRIENKELLGYTSVHIVAEVAHKLMTIEASTLFGWPMSGMANRLRRHPAEVMKLSAYSTALTQLGRSRIDFLEISWSVLQTASSICQQTGLLTNDALIIGVMQQHGLARLASHDSDLDGIPGVTRFAPV